MPAGIRVWDPNTQQQLIDTTTWCGQILGVYNVGVNHGAGSFSDLNLALGRPFVFVLPSDGNTGVKSTGNPVNTSASISGTTINYTAAPSACVIIYGIF